MNVLFLNSFLDSGDFCRLLIAFANSLDPDQARHNVCPDLGPNHLTLRLFLEEFFFKKLTLKKVSRRQQKHEKLEDLKVLRRSPDLLNNVKIGQGQLQLIMKQILFYHILGLQPFWSSFFR